MKSVSYTVENTLKDSGSLLVAGIDEVGRGSLAGPLVAAAVALPYNCSLELFDSKVLNAKTRTTLSEEIKTMAIGFGLGWVTNVEIDENGLAWALQEVYIRALLDINLEISKIILDGNVNYLREYELCETCIKGDSKIACVSAASIIAKVARDNYMYSQSVDYPEYGYETNVGYGTISHRKAICKYGVTDLHRTSFCRSIV